MQVAVESTARMLQDARVGASIRIKDSFADPQQSLVGRCTLLRFGEAVDLSRILGRSLIRRLVKGSQTGSRHDQTQLRITNMTHGRVVTNCQSWLRVIVSIAGTQTQRHTGGPGSDAPRSQAAYVRSRFWGPRACCGTPGCGVLFSPCWVEFSP